MDPTLEIKYVNGTLTKIADTDKFILNDEYYYQPKTEKEIQHFAHVELNSPVRIALYRKKNSNVDWKVASCFISKDSPCLQVNL